MTPRKKYLTELSVDADNCRIYVSDRNNNRYVLVDHGHTHEKSGLPRFELFTHTNEGEPETPLPDVYWEFPDTQTDIPWILNQATFLHDALFDNGELTPLTNHEHALKIALNKVDVEKLGALDRRYFEQHHEHSDKASSLEIIINTVEGDFSQLSPELIGIAEVFFGDAKSEKEVDHVISDSHYRVFVLSMNHLSSNDMLCLEHASSDRDEDMVMRQTSSFFIKLDEELDSCLRHGHSESIKAIIRYAFNNGYRMVEFDRDADTSLRFATYR